MSAFEFLFTFYGLLLGLALANVATGFADMWRGRDDIRIGICVPALGLAVMAFSIGQWHSAWIAQKALAVGPWQLLISVGVTLPQIFISQAMFPKNTERWRSLDDYYLTNARVLLGALLISPIVAVIANMAFGFRFNLTDAIRLALTLLLPAGLIFLRNRWAHAAGLLVVAGYYIASRLFVLF